MRILYGVQATGQGHISRARAMATALQDKPVDITWLFSGRPKDQLFDMQPFGDFTHRAGLSFVTRAGRVRYFASWRHNQLRQFMRDVRSLDVSGYDVIVTDFEPVTAWAGRFAGVHTIGIGHQYAFGPATPTRGSNWLSDSIMRHFAPADLPLGLHWSDYAANIFPPLLDLPELDTHCADHFLVYLPFEDQAIVTALLQSFEEHQFIQYAPGLQQKLCANVQLMAPDIGSFKHHLASSRGVICNSGFELISECLQWRKPVLTRPLQGQVEQQSNALALRQLGYATTMDSLQGQVIEQWLASPQLPPQLQFPDVAAALATWLADGACAAPAALAADLWRKSAVANNAPNPSPPAVPMPLCATAGSPGRYTRSAA
tara:strand:- start:290210 stop:291328 length:1119 start_codon:yes stop_codon:yes gene_type:complete